MISKPRRRHGSALCVRGSDGRPCLKATGLRKRRWGGDQSGKDLHFPLRDWEDTDFVERNSRPDRLPHVAGWLLRMVLSRCRCR